MAVTRAADVLELLGIDPPLRRDSEGGDTRRGNPVSLSEIERRVLQALDYQPCNFDEVLTRSGATAREVAAALISLELAGMVRTEPGLGYSRTPRRK